LHNHVAPSPLEIWRRPPLHSAEQQLALIGWTGVPVTDRPATRLAVTERAAKSVSAKLAQRGISDDEQFAIIHPAAALETKRWATENFARVIPALTDRGFVPVVIVAPNETRILDELRKQSSAVAGFSDLSLPEVTALASRARLFVGNDSGMAHIAAAAGAPSVVIFGSSNRNHWRPWTTQPSEIVFDELPCQPCHGYFCSQFEKPECIRRVPVERVVAAIDRVIGQNN